MALWLEAIAPENAVIAPHHENNTEDKKLKYHYEIYSTTMKVTFFKEFSWRNVIMNKISILYEKENVDTYLEMGFSYLKSYFKYSLKNKI